MATYELITDAAREFDGDYSYASVLDSQHQTGANGNELLIVTEVNEADAAKYEASLEVDSAVIVWSRLQD